VINHTHNCNADDVEIRDSGFSPKIVMCVMHLILGVALGLVAIAGVGVYLALA
jgi:hypothetical protein